MTKIRQFWENGGGKAIEWTIILSLLVYLISLSFNAGKMVKRIEVVEDRTKEVETIARDISEIKTEIRFIKDILQKKYK